MNKPHTALYRIPVLFLISLFAICTLLAASYGMKNYRMIEKASQSNFIGRTGLAYIATKIRQSRAVAVELPDSHTLTLIEMIDDQEYATSIYFKEGMLVESFGRYTPEAATFDTVITATHVFVVASIAENLVEITLGDDTGAMYKMTVQVPWKEAGL